MHAPASHADTSPSAPTAAPALHTRPLRIAYPTVYDSADVSNWSGLGLHIRQSLERAGAELMPIGPLRRQIAPLNVFRYLWNTKVQGLHDHPHRDMGFLKAYARQVERELVHMDAEVVLAPGGLPLAMVNTHVPLALWTDCTFASLENYYGAFAHLSSRTHRDGNQADQSLFSRLTHAFFSSHWAAQSAINDYGFPRESIDVVPFGANTPGLAHEDAARQAVRDRLEGDAGETCRMIFIGVDWERKGGETAVATCERLNARGIKTELLVVGVDVPEHAQRAFVKPLGFIRKAEPAGMQRLGELIASSHFLIVPSQAEAYGLVFAEAASYATPSLATNTGGIGDAVNHGVSGYLFDLDAPADDWADTAEALWRDRERYEALCLSAYHDFASRTNWDVAGRAVVSRLTDLVRGEPASDATQTRTTPNRQRKVA